LLVSLLLLSLPWAGCQFIGELEAALRKGQEQSLQATARAIGSVLGTHPELIYPTVSRRGDAPDTRTAIYAFPVESPVIVDGYADGWDDIPAVSLPGAAEQTGLAVTYQAITRRDQLYLLLRIQDNNLVYHNPGISPEPNGDRVVLRTWQNNRRQDYAIATAAPGSVKARPVSRRERGVDPGRIHGYWQDAVGGYTLELAIPLSYTGDRLGFYVVDAATGRGQPVATVGNITSLDTAAPPWLIYTPGALQETLAAFGEQDRRIQVIDQHYWKVADISPVGQASSQGPKTFWLLQWIYRSALAEDPPLPTLPTAPSTGKVQGEEIDRALQGHSGSLRYRDPYATNRTYLSASAPILHEGQVIGAVAVSQSAEQYLSLTDQAFSRLLGYSLLALSVGVMALLAYASLLSWRIGHLSRAARYAIAEDGSLTQDFPRSSAADEIGELSRRYADLLQKVREHNDYLRTLSRKLSHELRTPIALIQTSLEHLEQQGLKETERDTYLQRAREGLDRLAKILTAMSEATRLEESLRQNPLEPLDLVPLVREIFEAYQTLYPGRRLSLACELAAAPAQASADLLVQALDKLMDNAAAFAPADGCIEVGLAAAGEFWALSVANEGPALPDASQDRLFEPMVTLREGNSGAVHLGLGLHVVRLIADYHGGQAVADNLPAERGVRFTLLIPAIKKAP
jgi:dedicated sortase system histidine kinase